jgi:hypothetical protein
MKLKMTIKQIVQLTMKWSFEMIYLLRFDEQNIFKVSKNKVFGRLNIKQPRYAKRKLTLTSFDEKGWNIVKYGIAPS